MPRRYQPPARRRKKKRSRPNIPVAASSPPLVVEPPAVDAPQSVLQQAVAAPAREGTASRHVARDYSYVIVELRRIALVMAFIMAGLFVAAATLRWL